MVANRDEFSADVKTALALRAAYRCPPGDPNEVVEVRTKKPLKAGYDMVKVTGTFSFANNGEKGLFFRLEGGS